VETGELLSRIETALSPQPSPSLEEVLAEIGRRGVVTGGLNRVLQGYKIYVTYVAEKIAQMAPQHEDIKKGAVMMKQLLDRLGKVAEGVLKMVREHIDSGITKINGVGVYEAGGHKSYYVKIGGVKGEMNFPNLLSGTELEPFQLGWRASDESRVGKYAALYTTQLWQLYAWLAVRPGRVKIYLPRLNLTRHGASPMFVAVAECHIQAWSKDEAQKLAIEYIKRGDYRPLLTWWLGDGSVKWSFVEKRHYKLRISAGDNIKQQLTQLVGGFYERREKYFYLAGGKRLFKDLIESAGDYGKLLDILSPHKWQYLKFIYTPRRKYKRSPPSNVPNVIYVETPSGTIGLRLQLVFNEGGALYAVKYCSSQEEAHKVAEALRRLSTEPRITKGKTSYAVYIPTQEFIKLIKNDRNLYMFVKEYINRRLEIATEQQKAIILKLVKRLGLE
jgi:hypothetical protein